LGNQQIICQLINFGGEKMTEWSVKTIKDVNSKTESFMLIHNATPELT